MFRRPLSLESLETRRVMDAALTNCLSNSDTQLVAAEQTASASEKTSISPETLDSQETLAASMFDSSGMTTGWDGAAWTSMVAAFPAAKVYRGDSMLIAISNTDTAGNQKLWAIREGGENGGEIAFSLELGQLWNERVFFDGDQLLVMGDRGAQYYVPGPVPIDDGEKPSPIPLNHDSQESPLEDRPGTDVLAINLKSGEVVKRLSLPSGYIKYADFTDGQATLLLQRNDLAVPMIWPPVKVNDELYRFTFNQDGVGEPQLTKVPSGQASVSGNRLFIATDEYSEVNQPNQPITVTSSISFFTMTSNGIESDGKLDIGASRLMRIQSTEDSDRVALVTTSSGELGTNGVPQWSTTIQLIELSGASPTVVETLSLPQANPNPDKADASNQATSSLIWWNPSPQLLASNSRYLVFQDLAARSLSVVSLASDVGEDDRLLTVELPEEIQLAPGGIEAGSDQMLFLSGYPYWNILPVDLNRAPGDGRPVGTAVSNLISLSLTDGMISVHKIGEDQSLSDLQWIDSSTQRIGFIQYSSTTNERSFVFGHLDETGTFIEDGALQYRGFQETFYPTTESITVATASGLKTYAYEDTTEPLYEVRFFDPKDSPLVAQDDSIELYPSSFDPINEIQTDWIDLLANDQIPFYSQFSTQIVELIDAPSGVNLVAGRYIWLDARVESLDEPLTFKYRASDGISETTGEVEIKLASITEEQRKQVLDSIKKLVSQQFLFDPEVIVIEAAASLGDNADVPLPRDPNSIGPDGSLPPYWRKPVLSQSPWFVFRVTAPGFEAIYGSDLSANAVLLSIVKQDQEDVLTISVVATDDAGTKIDTVDQGQTFWIEIQATDLRRLPQGVFSAFVAFDLPDQLTTTGDSEPGKGFAFVGGIQPIEKAAGQRISLGVIDSDGRPLESLSNGSQTLMRLRVTATSSGKVNVAATLSPTAGEETTVFESSRPLTADQVRILNLSLQIREPVKADEPSDVDGDGEVRPLDALRVINMVSKHGVGTIEVIRQRLEASTAVPPSKIDVSRMDVNRDNLLTPLDALLVINRISQKNRANSAGAQGEAPEDQGIAAATSQDIDDVIAKRRKRS